MIYELFEYQTLKSSFVVVDLFLFCYERDFMLSLSDNNQTDIIEALTQPPNIKMTYLILSILIF